MSYDASLHVCNNYYNIQNTWIVLKYRSNEYSVSNKVTKYLKGNWSLFVCSVDYK